MIYKTDKRKLSDETGAKRVVKFVWLCQMKFGLH